MKRKLGWMTCALAGIMLAAEASDSRADLALQAAIKKETVDGDLKGAIEQYRKLAQVKDRALAAKALIRMGECYEKLGDSEARKIYERVVREYGDQKEAVTTAQSRLGGNGDKRRQTTTLVWSGRIDDEGTVSPDGRYLSFTDWNTGDLGVRDLATGENRILTHTGNPLKGDWKDFSEESAISRDGKQIAFSWWDNDAKRYDLRVVNTSGEPNSRLLYDDPGNKWLAPRDWSPDGKSIVVIVSRNDNSDRIGLVSVADGSLRILRSGDLPGNTRIFFSPDGKYVGYDLPESHSSQPRDLFVFDIQAGREIPVAVRRGQDIMVGWALDGKRLLFASDRGGGMGLWSQPFVDGKPQGAPDQLKPDLGEIESLGVTRSGSLYYGIRSGGRNESTVRMGTFDLATGRISEAHDVSQNYPESNNFPCWSRDGKFFAYLQERGSGKYFDSRIVIRSAETGVVVRELPNRMLQLAGWSPDGKSLLAMGYNSGSQGAFRIDAQTGTLTPLVTDPAERRSIQTAKWSPDGSLYYVRASENGADQAIFRREPSGSERELIRRTSFGWLSFSPDGRFMVTPGVDAARNLQSVLLMAADGSAIRDLMSVPINNEELKVPAGKRKGPLVWSPVWSPDGESVLIRKRESRDSANDEYWLAPLSGGAPRKLEEPIGKNTWIYGFQPNGRQLLYTVVSPAPTRLHQIWSLENFLPAAKQ